MISNLGLQLNKSVGHVHGDQAEIESTYIVEVRERLLDF